MNDLHRIHSLVEEYGSADDQDRMRAIEEVIRAVAAISEHGRGDPGEPYDAQVSLLTITKARKLLEAG